MSDPTTPPITAEILDAICVAIEFAVQEYEYRQDEDDFVDDVGMGDDIKKAHQWLTAAAAIQQKAAPAAAKRHPITSAMYAEDPMYCPNCHTGDNLQPWNDSEYDDDPLVRPIRCGNCGCKWTDRLSLIGYEDLRDAKGEPITETAEDYTDADYAGPDGSAYPVYMTPSAKDLPPGLYITLWNGYREHVPLAMRPDDWGFNGPMIGPLDNVQTTYGQHLKLTAADGYSLAHYFPDRPKNDEGFYDLIVDVEGCVIHDGCRYGDWTVDYYAGKPEADTP